MALQRTTRKKRLRKKRIIHLVLLLFIIFLFFFLDTFPFSPQEVKDQLKKDVRNQQERTIAQLPDAEHSDEKVVYLTFDDGPTSATDDVLEILKEYGAKATFFMLSPHMEERSNLVKQMVQEGHGVGLHGVTHDLNRFYKSEQTVLNEMNEAQQVLENIAGVHSSLIRTPYGSVPYLTKPYRKALKEQGYELWDWNIDSRDWDRKDGKYVENLIDQIQSIEGNGATPVVLLHDQSQTAQSLAELLTYLTEHGFEMKKLDSSVEPVQFRCYDRCHQLPKL
ncbi:polysaccharide deacetylase family protein [Radiobacillus deserti]|uniref:Polysaccharide deacetylase n=1 Tax=Radiobacillus deserti TaxID=2594883 RepID=A0A516KJB8_9BACI|nr:polysaccharide deacetylase family protein [Radiobacillus deserti]QDP41497.1 polysaccharide deacetylase [Radiobacillus deserti]